MQKKMLALSIEVRGVPANLEKEFEGSPMRPRLWNDEGGEDHVLPPVGAQRQSKQKKLQETMHTKPQCKGRCLASKDLLSIYGLSN